jgi:hypothetical protein
MMRPAPRMAARPVTDPSGDLAAVLHVNTAMTSQER